MIYAWEPFSNRRKAEGLEIVYPGQASAERRWFSESDYDERVWPL